MQNISNDRRVRGAAQVGFRRDYQAAMLRTLDQINGVVRRAAGADGYIPVTNAKIREVQTQAGQILIRFFADPTTRQGFATDEVTPLAEYGRIFNKWYVYVVAGCVKAQHQWMKRHTPQDIWNWLASTRTRHVPVMEVADRTKAQVKAINDKLALMQPDNFLLWREAEDNPYLQQPDESLDDYKARLKDLRIFEPNPLAEYEPSHKWVDPKGYTLSSRIWNTGEETRKQMDGLIADAIRSGMSAEQLAKKLEQFLLPERANLRTQKPYGKDGSYWALLLARTEIARAANQAAFIAAQMNPYVTGLDIARSGSGDPRCPVCPRYATIDIGGSRVRDPYPLVRGSATVPIPPFHPQCMDRTESVVTEDTSMVSRRIRGAMESDDPELQPYTTPAKYQSFITDLLGETLIRAVGQAITL